MPPGPTNDSVVRGACSNCGNDVEAAFRFCPFCGSPMGSAAPSLIERRVIAVLFCDLVNFSELAYRTDAEDIQQLLARYLALTRSCLESYGAVVEKFIGDAVVAVFGYDAAHDDDCERALLAALGVLDALGEYNRSAAHSLHVHLGIHVGEAVADLGASPAAGEGFIAGHVVNLAQRLQSLAPPDAVVVSREVVDRTKHRFSFEPQPPSIVKGHPGPLEHWQLRGVRQSAAPGVLPLVGRTRELAQLETHLHAVAQRPRSQVVTLSGEAGSGKSRLLLEFESLAKVQPFPVTWRKGRCLPYGTGVTFSALAEVLKQSTGVLDSDSFEVVTSKVESAFESDPDADWVVPRLLPLLGVTSSSVEREEMFSAWVTALVSLSRDVPTILVIEDVHWADAAMRAFVEHVAAQSLPSHLLLVLSTRPSLLEANPGWPSERTHQLPLHPLDATAMEQVVAAELGQPGQVLSMSLRHSLLERAAGNPLFAREFARLVRDSRRLGGSDPDEADSLPVPATIHALLGARLDTLSLVERAIVQCAAVIGKIFWAGAICVLGDADDEDVRGTLDTLSRRGIVRRHDRSSLAGEEEYSFSHVLLRDVAYDRAPRAWRRHAHLRAIEWMEMVANSRVDEVAEVLVFHAMSALDLATLAGDSQTAARATVLALTYSRLAARRAMALDVRQAFGMLEIARGLTPPGDPTEPETLLSWAAVAFALDRVAEATDVRRSVVETLRAGGDQRLLAKALMDLGDGYYQLGDLERALSADREAAEIGRSLAPTEDAGDPVANLALTLAATVADEEGLAVADEAEQRAASAGLPIPLSALRARAVLRLQFGDPSGVADHDEALRRLAAERAPISRIASALSARAEGVRSVSGPDAALAAYAEAVDYATSHGLVNIGEWTKVTRLGPLLESGDVAEVLAQARAAVPAQARSLIGIDALGALVAAATELERMDVLDACRLEVVQRNEAALEQGRQDPEGVVVTVLAGARCAYLAGDRDAAIDLLDRFMALPKARETSSYGHHLLGYVRLALACEAAERAHVLATPDRPDRTLRGLAQRTAVGWLDLEAGEYVQAGGTFSASAQQWWAVGNRLEHSYCLVGRATALAALGDQSAPSARGDAQRARAALGLAWPRIAPTPVDLGHDESVDLENPTSPL
jgi:class 3 adenylate cyclase/tetratricopeptide (TPR) repeat protein